MKYTITIGQDDKNWEVVAKRINGEETTRARREFSDPVKAFEWVSKKIAEWQETASRQPATSSQKQVATAAKV